MGFEPVSSEKGGFLDSSFLEDGHQEPEEVLLPLGAMADRQDLG